VITAAVALTLALSGRFAALAAVSGVSRLVVYLLTCASTLRLRNARFAARVDPPQFSVPFGPLVPLLAIAFALAILAGASAAQLSAGAYALAAGALLYLLALRSSVVRKES
jgi:L-asparagine transporter-like permease